jgi:ribosomal protein S18 acetylase RimI-like enzyme
MFRITPATKMDLNECENLGRFKEFKEASGDYIDAKFLANYLSRDFFLVAKDGKKVIAYLVSEKLKAKGAVIWYFVVKKEFRNQGIGRAMLEKLEDNCRKRGIEWIYFYAVENKHTLKFYKSMGYKMGPKETECIKLLNVKKFKDLKF